MLNWIQKHFLGNIFDLFKKIWLLLKFSKEISIEGKKNWQETINKSKKVEPWNEEERRIQFNDMISEHKEGDFEKSVTNLMIFSFITWFLSISFLFVSVFNFSILSLFFSISTFIFSLMGLGYPIWMIRKRLKIAYIEYLYEILHKNGWKFATPVFHVRLRG